MFSAYSYRSHYQTSNCFIRHLPSSLNKQSSYSSSRHLRRYPLPGKQKPRTIDSPRVISNAMRPRCFRRFSSSCVIQRSSGAAFLRCSASPPEPKSGSYCTIAFNQAVSCWLCTIAETVGLSPAATLGAPFIPVGKDAMTPWIFFSSRSLFYHIFHYVTRFYGRFVVQTPPKKVPQN